MYCISLSTFSTNDLFLFMDTFMNNCKYHLNVKVCKCTILGCLIFSHYNATSENGQADPIKSTVREYSDRTLNWVRLD